MPQPKTLDVRQKELQTLLATPAVQSELQGLAARYAASSGRIQPLHTSLITYILVHERERGLIRG